MYKNSVSNQLSRSQKTREDLTHVLIHSASPKDRREKSVESATVKKLFSLIIQTGENSIQKSFEASGCHKTSLNCGNSRILKLKRTVMTVKTF